MLLDREDHSFCGIAFPIQCKTILPVDHIVINSVAVRGALGHVTVWVTKENDTGADGEDTHRPSRGNNLSIRYNTHEQDGNDGVHDPSGVKRGNMLMKEKYWDKVFDGIKRPSFHQYCSLDLGANPIVLKPGEIRGIYIHSTLESDKAIVYDNRHSLKTHDDQFLTVLPGRAHVSPEVFGTRPIWGFGNSWRENREFVGRISYGVVYKLWNPCENLSFGGNFRNLARVLFMCQRRWESQLSVLSDDCIFYILNMCRWDWMGDSFEDLRVHKKKMNLLETVRVQSTIVGENGDINIEEMIDNNNANGVESVVLDGVEEHRTIGNFVHERRAREDEDSNQNCVFQFFYYNDTGFPDKEEVKEQRRKISLRPFLRHRIGGRRFISRILGSNR